MATLAPPPPPSNSTVDPCSACSVSTTYVVTNAQWWYCFFGAVACLLISGLASGVNIGLMSLSPLSLRLFTEAEAEDKRRDPTLRLQARRAARVLPLVARKHVVLVTLLLTTAIADEVLPLCIDAIAPTWVAVVLSVTTMLLFTEVIPTAVFTDHRNSLKLAASLSPFVWVLIGVLGIITWPMSRALEVFVERTHRQVGDPESVAGSVRGEEESPDSERRDQAHKEARQLLKGSAFKSLLRIMRREAAKVESMPVPLSEPPHADNLHSGLGAAAEAEDIPPQAIVAKPRPNVLKVTQLCLAERVVVELAGLRMRDVMEPLGKRQLLWSAFSTSGARSEGAPGDWPSAFSAHCIEGGLQWFVVQGLRDASSWDVFWSRDVLLSATRGGGKEGTFLDALLECVTNGSLITAPEDALLLDVEESRRRHHSGAPFVLVTSATHAERAVGVVHMIEAMRLVAVPEDYWARGTSLGAGYGGSTRSERRGLPQSTSVAAHNGGRRWSLVHGGGDNSDEEDISTLLNAPREANAIPWSIKYASSKW